MEQEEIIPTDAEEVFIELPTGLKINLKSAKYTVKELTAQALGLEQYFENKIKTKNKDMPTGVS